MKTKRALITGITGQDGAYLASFLVKEGYEVFGGCRKKVSNNRLWRLKELGIEKEIKIKLFDLLDENNINRVIRDGKYDEIYNLAAQSYVDKSFVSPLYTSNVNTLGVIRILEALRKLSKSTKFYQASSSEMYGNTGSRAQDENTTFKPISPYAISKLHAHRMQKIYREVYNLYCCSGILFNHDSPLRSNEFVSKKIVSELVRVKYRKTKYLYLGNIYAKRDWGYSMDYVEAMWKMLQQKKPDDYVISSGKSHSVKSFVTIAAKYIGFNLKWRGKGLNENAYDTKTKKTIIRIKKELFRPTEIKSTFGNSSKANRILKWSPKTNFNQLVKIMSEAELKKYE